MKKILILTIAIGLLVSSCLPASATEVPGPVVDLDATAAVFVQQTLQSFPSATAAPSNTPVVVTDSTATPTDQALKNSDPTLTGTLVTSTNTAVTYTSTQTTASNSTPTATFTSTPNSAITATETLHVRLYGTLPPNVPYNGIDLVNKSKAEAYISLQVTVADGSTTILEYPVGKLTSIQAPVGKYKYVLWVGGNKLVGSFALSSSNDLRITIYKDRVEIKKR